MGVFMPSSRLTRVGPLARGLRNSDGYEAEMGVWREGPCFLPVVSETATIAAAVVLEVLAIMVK